MNKYSNYYYEIIEKYKLFHTRGIKNLSGSKTFLGYSLTKWIIKIKEIIKINNCNSLIDFDVAKVFYIKIKLKLVIVNSKIYQNSGKFKIYTCMILL